VAKDIAGFSLADMGGDYNPTLFSKTKYHDITPFSRQIWCLTP